MPQDFHRCRAALAGIAVSACLLSATIGCSRQLPATVSGQVTLDGQPFTTGLVTFYPVGRGPAATGQIQSDGRYEIQTGRQQGFQTGDYRVTVESFDVSNQLEDEIATPLHPARYADRNTSGLEFTIIPGHQTIDLPLTSQ